MFHNLVESCAQHDELARRGKFFLGTLIMYALLLLSGAVMSIYAYDAHLGRQNLQFISLVTPHAPQPLTEQPAPAHPSTAAGGGADLRPPLQVRINDSLNNPNNPPSTVSTAPNPSLPILPNLPVAQGAGNFNEGMFGGPGRGDVPGTGGNNSGNMTGGAPLVRSSPPPPAPSPPPAPPRTITSRVLNGMAIRKPAPPYPPAARAIGVSGTVTVQILVDEQGRVIQARALSGHPFLRSAAESAAYQARFTPTILGNQAVRVSGTITYNFVLQ